MSSDVIARVLALTHKFEELAKKGHLLRAAENCGRAAEAARALGADNLVTLNLLMQRGHALNTYAVSAPDAADPRVLAAHRAEGIALLSDAMEALERRRVAGTLLEGTCSAAEEAWRFALLEQENPGIPAAALASRAALVGCEQFMSAALFLTKVLTRTREFQAECSDAQFLSFAQHIVRAAELMQQPRRHVGRAMFIDAAFTDALRKAVAELGADSLDARLVQLLAGAWQQLQRSGVLQERGVEERILQEAPIHRATNDALRKSLNATGLRSCALDGCGATEAHPAHFKSPAACRAVVYCCREHQVAGWPGHKKACKAARKAAAAEDGAGPSSE